MPQSKEQEDVEDALEPIDQRVAQAQATWREEAKRLGELASAFAPLARPATYEDLARLPRLLETVTARVELLALDARGSAVLEQVREELRERKRHMQERLAKDLAAQCRESGLELRVIRREEPVEIRIPPFAVRIDRERGRAELRFARLPIGSCAATAEAIVELHGKTLEAYRRDFRAEAFLQACLQAWRAARGAGCSGTGERVEILDFLPYLTLQFQSTAFRVEPNASNFHGYSRARFAFDVLRLRNERALNIDGWRMNLGVATGTTATKRNRTIFFEDEHGDGEFKLTVFFTRSEDRQ